MIDNEVQTLLKKVFGDLNYEKIILFGSRARGDSSERSDYDILIIMEEDLSIKEKMRLLIRLKRELAKKEVDADIIIKSSNEVDYYKDKIGSVVRNALREGVAL